MTRLRLSTSSGRCHSCARTALLGILLGCGTPVTAQDVYYSLPSWSPNGRTISFESNRDGEAAVYTIRPDGTGLRRLTPTGTSGEQPNWTPDGESLVFTSRRSGTGQLYLMNADGGDVRPIPGTDSGFLAAYSADGRWLLFATQDAPPSSHYRVFVMQTDGSRRHELGDTASSNEDPRWTSDGRVGFSTVPILERGPDEPPPSFVRRREAARRWFSADPGAGDVRQVTAGEIADSSRDRGLSPDGRWLVVSKSAAKGASLVLREVATGAERVLDTGG